MTTENPIKSVGDIAATWSNGRPFLANSPPPEIRRLTWDQILADIPTEYRDAVPSDPVSKAIWPPHEQEIHQCILLHGKPGTGKTHQAYALLVRDRKERGRALVQDGVSVPSHAIAMESWAREQVDKLRSRDQVKILTEAGDLRPHRYDHAWLDKACAYRGVLVVDDIGFTKPNDWVTEAIYHLANERRAWKRRTIWTTNLCPADLRDAFSPAIASRLAGGVVIELTGRDRRVQ